MKIYFDSIIQLIHKNLVILEFIILFNNTIVYWRN